MYRVNVSSVQDFMQCRFRWWAKWVMNRVPVATSPALDAGRILHRAFERHFNGEPLEESLWGECYEFRKLIPSAHPSAQPGALKAVQQMEDLAPAMPLWRDKFEITEVLEVEQPFEWPDPETDVIWIGRPDRVVVVGNKVWHEQNRGLASGMNFGTYMRLALRHYHEHLYAHPLSERYCTKRRRYGGTIMNLVRKLKFVTGKGRKTAEEMFFQSAMSVNLESLLHRSVMDALRDHVSEMRRVEELWRQQGAVPPPNEKLNGGFAGNSEDPYFRVLIGEVGLLDSSVFKDREDTYAQPTTG
jgi:hypothetical protein